jgi:ATP-dependent protease HslVU (ClpYQ) peptidase subunit
MTIICARPGEIAADTAVWSGQLCRSVGVRKLFALYGGEAMIGLCGCVNAIPAALEAASQIDPIWSARNGAPVAVQGWPSDENKDAFAIIATQNGDLLLVEKGACWNAKNNFVAIGAAQDVAHGALAAGASAREAAQIAIDWHDGAAGDVISFRWDVQAAVWREDLR